MRLFVFDLKSLALKSEFEVFLEKAPRDRVVCGLHNVPIPKILLVGRQLTFQQAFKQVQSMEMKNKVDFRYADALLCLADAIRFNQTAVGVN